MTDPRDRIQEVLRRTAEQRESTATTVVDVHEDVARLTTELERAQTRYRAAWTAATRAGWSDSELRELGVTTPSQPRRRRRKSTPAPQGEPGGDS